MREKIYYKKASTIIKKTSSNPYIEATQLP
jgi:hypothetical protein